MGRELKEKREEKISNVETNHIHENPRKLHIRALEALKKAKELEARTMTKKVVSEDGKIICFVKIK